MSNIEKYQEQYLEAIKKDYNNLMYIPTEEVTIDILQEIVTKVEKNILDLSSLRKTYLTKLYSILVSKIDLIKQYERDEELNKLYNSNIPINKDIEDEVFTLYEIIEILSEYLDDLLEINASSENQIITLSTIIDCRIRNCYNFIEVFKLVEKVKRSKSNRLYNLHNSIKRLSEEVYGKYLFFTNTFFDSTLDFTDYRNYFTNCSFNDYIEECKKYKEQLEEYIEEQDKELV